MKYPVLVALMVAATAYGEPRQLSQHPRVGELCEIDFAPRSTLLPDDMEDKLGQVAAWSRQNPDGLIVIGGHADPSDGKTAALLSLRRAEAVRDKLVAAGVEPEMIVLAAYGELGPGAGRRVTVWATHQDLATVSARLEATGARILRTRTTVAGD